MGVMVIRIAVHALGTVVQVLEERLKELKIRGRIRTIEAKALLRLPITLKRVLEI